MGARACDRRACAARMRQTRSCRLPGLIPSLRERDHSRLHPSAHLVTRLHRREVVPAPWRKVAELLSKRVRGSARLLPSLLEPAAELQIELQAFVLRFADHEYLDEIPLDCFDLGWTGLCEPAALRAVPAGEQRLTFRAISQFRLWWKVAARAGGFSRRLMARPSSTQCRSSSAKPNRRTAPEWSSTRQSALPGAGRRPRPSICK